CSQPSLAGAPFVRVALRQGDRDGSVKTCSKCGRSLPQTMFWGRAASVDGLQYQCKECMQPGYEAREAERQRAERARRAREWRANNRERVRKYNASRRDVLNANRRIHKFRQRVANHLQETEA